MKKAKQPTSYQPKITPTFLLELPLQVNSQQAKHLHGHFEAARHLYNALLSEAVQRLRHMRADARWQEARLIPRSEKQARKAAFAALRKAFGFTEYALHLFATQANTTWLADIWLAPTGSQWATLLGTFGPQSTAQARFQEWVQEGVFESLPSASTNC